MTILLRVYSQQLMLQCHTSAEGESSQRAALDKDKQCLHCTTLTATPVLHKCRNFSRQLCRSHYIAINYHLLSSPHMLHSVRRIRISGKLQHNVYLLGQWKFMCFHRLQKALKNFCPRPRERNKGKRVPELGQRLLHPPTGLWDKSGVANAT